MPARPTPRWSAGLPLGLVVVVGTLVASACSSGAGSGGSDAGPPSSDPTSPSASAAPERPDESTTGVPAGVELEPSEGLEITEDGAVVEGLHITGSVVISADDVTFRDSLVQTDTSLYPVVVDGASDVVIEDIEVDNMGGTGIGIFISDSSVTVRRADVHSAEDGIRIQSDDVTIEDSYVHDLQRHSGGHHDAVQIRSGDDITLEGNTLLPFNEETDDEMNAAVQIGSLVGDDQITDLRVIDNYMDGGGFTVNGGGRDEVDSATYAGNRFGRNYRFAVSGNLDGSTWDDSNVWDDTGTPAR